MQLNQLTAVKWMTLIAIWNIFSNKDKIYVIIYHWIHI